MFFQRPVFILSISSLKMASAFSTAWQLVSIKWLLKMLRFMVVPLRSLLGGGLPWPRTVGLVVLAHHPQVLSWCRVVTRRLSVRGTIVVATQDVEENPSAADKISWSDLATLQDCGWEVATVGRAWEDLTVKSQDELVTWVDEAVEVFTRHLGSAPQSFVYPLGASDTQLVQILMARGFRWAVAGGGGFNLGMVHPLNLKSIAVSNKSYGLLAAAFTLAKEYMYFSLRLRGRVMPEPQVMPDGENSEGQTA